MVKHELICRHAYIIGHIVGITVMYRVNSCLAQASRGAHLKSAAFGSKVERHGRHTGKAMAGCMELQWLDQRCLER